jgi:hypothetical protein
VVVDPAGGAELVDRGDAAGIRQGGSGGEDSEDEVVCRYCLEAEPKEALFWPCRCTNPVHTSCLQTWLRGAVCVRAWS